jgi:hypothetical protein
MEVTNEPESAEVVVAREMLGLLRDIRGLVQVVADALGAFSPEDITRWRGLLRTGGSQSSGDARRMAIWQELERETANRLPVQPPASKAPTKARSKGTKQCMCVMQVYLCRNLV